MDPGSVVAAGYIIQIRLNGPGSCCGHGGEVPYFRVYIPTEWNIAFDSEILMAISVSEYCGARSQRCACSDPGNCKSNSLRK